MPDTMESTRQDVQQEPAHELVGGNGHDALPVGPLASVVPLRQYCINDAGGRSAAVATVV